MEGVTGDEALVVLVDINEELQAAGDARLPIILYAIEAERLAGVHT